MENFKDKANFAWQVCEIKADIMALEDESEDLLKEILG